MPLIRFAPLLLLAIPVPALAQSMNAESFHQRATKLQKKGPMAIFSGGEIKALMREGQAAGKRARELRVATIKTGGKLRYCPPEKGSMDSNEFMTRLSAIPQADRTRIDMTEATIRIMAVKFPCPSNYKSRHPQPGLGGAAPSGA
ncbi:MAG: hypothetical protein ACR2FK_01595 [Sphingomicrobium sp.]